MSKIESLEKLRNGMGGYGTGDNNFVTLKKEAFDRYCDAIQEEVDKAYMRLPVDADGVPIHVGDVVYSKIWPDGVMVYEISFTDNDGDRVYDDSGMYCLSGVCSHVKPRTVEDVLLDFLKESRDFSLKRSGEVDEAIKRYSSELKMRGDAEC